jgi:hypothetical protein
MTNFYVTAVIQVFFILSCFSVSPAADSAQVFPLAALKAQCIALSEVKIGPGENDAAECAVTEFESLGEVDGQNYYYARYCLIPNHSKDQGGCRSDTFNGRYFQGRASAVFIQDGADKARLVFERAYPEIGMFVYEAPELVETAAGTVLVLAIALDGTGHGNESEYYLRKKGTWQKIESRSWVDDVMKKITPGVQMWKGLWIDLETMTAKAGLYRKGDANCCPTGGEAHIRAAIENDRFVVKSVKIEQGK